MFSARSRSYSERLNIKETDEHDKKAATTETIRSLSRGGGRGAGSRGDRRIETSSQKFPSKASNHDRRMRLFRGVSVVPGGSLAPFSVELHGNEGLCLCASQHDGDESSAVALVFVVILRATEHRDCDSHTFAAAVHLD
jgi:hypothetical protein